MAVFSSFFYVLILWPFSSSSLSLSHTYSIKFKSGPDPELAKPWSVYHFVVLHYTSSVWAYCHLGRYIHSEKIPYTSLSRSSRLLDLPSTRLDQLLIKFWTLEGAVNAVNGAAITIWCLKSLTNQIVSTMGAAITICRFIANDQSIRLPKIR